MANWLFLVIDERRFSFVYKIEKQDEALYNEPFNISIAITMIDLAKTLIKINQSYSIMRAEEIIGNMEVISDLQNN
jgi:hypothetical protein